MNNDQLLKQIEQIILPLKEGQKRLETNQEKFEKRLDAQGKDLKALKQDVNTLKQDVSDLNQNVNKLNQDVKTLDLKIEVVNANMKRNTKEITDILGNVLDNFATQEEIDKLDIRVTNLEEKISTKN